MTARRATTAMFRNLGMVGAALMIAVAPSAGQQGSPELRDQLERVRAATERFHDHDVAIAEGYELVGGDGPLMGEHWVRTDLTHRPFDIDAPSTLQYLKIGDEYVLTGVAYTVYRAPDDPLPEGFDGDQDAWHLHDMMKIAMTTTEDRPLLRWITDRRIATGKTQWRQGEHELTMVHAWIWLDNPDGVFAQDHRQIPYARLRLPTEWGAAASLDAAYGVSLLAPGGCELEVRKTSWLAAGTWAQRRRLREACTDAEAIVRDALDESRRAAGGGAERVSGATLNAVAEGAWRDYLEARGRILTTQQIERLAAMVEHPEGHHQHR